MIQNTLFKILMAPFALLYGLGVAIRNFFYDIGFLKEISFNIPVISIGNLTVGGAGKTPHVEYLVNWLKEYIELGVLSRGYKRKTKGFLTVGVNNTAQEVGDEPLQYKRKFPGIHVYVSESRVLGVPKIMAQQPQLQTIILDDAFQHRSIKPGLNILLTTYQDMFTQDFLLPMGRLREWRSAYRRANVIVVTKCPKDLAEEDKVHIRQRINLLEGQQLFFSTYQYMPMYSFLYPSVTMDLHPGIQALVISAIADTSYMTRHLESHLGGLKVMEYEDHHTFNRYEMAQLKKAYEDMDGSNKVIITTEKDATRLEPHRSYIRQEQMPVYVLPVFVSFGADDQRFKQLIERFLLSFKA